MRIDRHFPFLHRDRNLSQIIEDAYQRGLITSDDANRLMEKKA